MIQRVQTIWLFSAALCAFLTLQFPFFTGSTIDAPFVELNGQYNILLLSLTVIVGTLAFVSIFLYKNRTLQVRLGYAGLLVQVGIIALYFTYTTRFTAGTYALWSVLTFLVLIFYIMAITAINKDQKLVKSMDRLR